MSASARPPCRSSCRSAPRRLPRHRSTCSRCRRITYGRRPRRPDRGRRDPGRPGRARRDRRDKLVEALAETDDEIARSLPRGRDGRRRDAAARAARGTLAGKIIPVLCGSALKNKGVQPMLDAVIEYLPSPLDVPPVIGTDPRRRAAGDAPRRSGPSRSPRSPSRSSPIPSSGKLAFFRVYSGTLEDRLVRLQRDQGPEGADRAADRAARQPPRGDRVGQRRRHRRGGRPQEHLHRRHAVRRGQADHPRERSPSPSR